MEPLDRPDQLLVDAAEGWLGLGNHVEAFREIEQVSADAQEHPEVLRACYRVYAASKNWEPAAEVAEKLCQALPEHPFGPIQLAYALHELRRTEAAWTVLLPQAKRFPEENVIPYNLARYACQLGRLDDARHWLREAVRAAGVQKVRETGLKDPDLQPLWSEIREMQ